MCCSPFSTFFTTDGIIVRSKTASSVPMASFAMAANISTSCCPAFCSCSSSSWMNDAMSMDCVRLITPRHRSVTELTVGAASGPLMTWNGRSRTVS